MQNQSRYVFTSSCTHCRETRQTRISNLVISRILRVIKNANQSTADVSFQPLPIPFRCRPAGAYIATHPPVGLNRYAKGAKTTRALLSEFGNTVEGRELFAKLEAALPINDHAGN
jgi:hypothetical protein